MHPDGGPHDKVESLPASGDVLQPWQTVVDPLDRPGPVYRHTVRAKGARGFDSHHPVASVSQPRRVGAGSSAYVEDPTRSHWQEMKNCLVLVDEVDGFVPFDEIGRLLRIALDPAYHGVSIGRASAARVSACRRSGRSAEMKFGGSRLLREVQDSEGLMHAVNAGARS